MHLLVLSAFRPVVFDVSSINENESQCTFWCLVLSDGKEGYSWPDLVTVSQCTFWCLVLSDTDRAAS